MGPVAGDVLADSALGLLGVALRLIAELVRKPLTIACAFCGEPAILV